MEGIEMTFSWDNNESYLLFNPTYSKEEQDKFHKILPAAKEWKGHFWLSTSGSSSPKWVGLSKQALLSSAVAVNKHLASDETDAWVNPLPHFHVGGLGILARSHLSGAACHDFKFAHPGKWKAEAFYDYLMGVKGTLTSLVPAQLQDLVGLGLQAPPSLRAVIIGGGATLPELFEKAAALQWPVLPSYGLTECSSQVATAPLESWKQGRIPQLHLLSHLQGEVRDGRLCFSGPSLLSTYAYLDQEHVVFKNPKIQGWLKTEDRGTIEKEIVTILGREDAVVKVGGENVDLTQLDNHLQALKLQMGVPFSACLIAAKDERLGHAIHLASDSPALEDLSPLLNAFQNTVLPFERIRKTHLFPELPRSALGKILKQELLKLIDIHTR